MRIMASELKVDARRRWSFTSLLEAVAPALLPKSCANAGCGHQVRRWTPVEQAAARRALSGK